MIETNQQSSAESNTPADLTDPTASDTFPSLAKDASPEEVLAFNPFAKKTAGETDPQDGEKVATATQPLAGQQQISEPTPLLNKPDPQMDAIRSILTAQELDGGQEQEQQDQQTATANPFAVDWAVPEPLVQALMSQEPEQVQGAMSTLINGVANGVLQIMQEQMQQFASQGVPQMMQQREQAAQLNSKFYSKYPHLQKPELLQTVAKVAGAVARQQKAAGLSVDPMSDTFMSTVENYMVSNGFVMRPAGKQTRAKPAPAHFGNSNSRPSIANRPVEDLLTSIGL